MPPLNTKSDCDVIIDAAHARRALDRQFAWALSPLWYAI